MKQAPRRIQMISDLHTRAVTDPHGSITRLKLMQQYHNDLQYYEYLAACGIDPEEHPLHWRSDIHKCEQQTTQFAFYKLRQEWGVFANEFKQAIKKMLKPKLR